MKKLLKCLGTITLTSVPVVTAISCSSPSSNMGLNNLSNLQVSDITFVTSLTANDPKHVNSSDIKNQIANSILKAVQTKTQTNAILDTDFTFALASNTKGDSFNELDLTFQRKINVQITATKETTILVPGSQSNWLEYDLPIVAPSANNLVEAINAINNISDTEIVRVGSGGLNALKTKVTGDYIKGYLAEPNKSVFDSSKFILGSFYDASGTSLLPDNYFNTASGRSMITYTYTYNGINGKGSLWLTLALPTSSDIVATINSITTYSDAEQVSTSGGLNTLKLNLNAAFINSELPSTYKLYFSVNNFQLQDIYLSDGVTQLTDSYFNSPKPPTTCMFSYTYDSIKGAAKFSLTVTPISNQEILNAITTSILYSDNETASTTGGRSNLWKNIDSNFIKSGLSESMKSVFNNSQFAILEIYAPNSLTPITDAYFNNSKASSVIVVNFQYGGISGNFNLNLTVTSPSSNDIVNAINNINTMADTESVSDNYGYITLKAKINSSFIASQLNEPFKSSFVSSKFSLNDILGTNGITPLTDNYFRAPKNTSNAIIAYTYDGISGYAKLALTVSAPTSQSIVNKIAAITNYNDTEQVSTSGGVDKLKNKFNGKFIKNALIEPYYSAFDISKYHVTGILGPDSSNLTDSYFNTAKASTIVKVQFTYDNINTGFANVNLTVNAPVSQDVVNAINAITYSDTENVSQTGGVNALKTKINAAFIKSLLSEPYITAFVDSKFSMKDIFGPDGISLLTDDYFNSPKATIIINFTYLYDGIQGTAKLSLTVV